MAKIRTDAEETSRQLQTDDREQGKAEVRPRPLICTQSCDCHVICSEWYDRQSIMMCEEGVVISGLLMGLNAIDYNVLLRAEEFDKSVSLLVHTHTICR